jgi:hypothetical protein
MNNYFSLPVLVYVASMIFSIGGFVFAVRQMRKDLTGVAGIVRSEAAKAEERYLAVVVATLLVTPPDKQISIAGMFLSAGKGKNK